MAPTAGPESPATVRRRVPAEWWVALAFCAVGLWVLYHTPFHFARIDIQIYHNLAAAFGAGFLAMMAAAYGQALLRCLPAADRPRWRTGMAIFGTATAVAAFTLVRQPDMVAILRLLEVFALGVTVPTILVTLFLPASGLVSLRDFARVTGDFARVWLPILAYFAFGGICLTAIRLATPQVWDPVLLRMDLSLGWNPSVALHTPGAVCPWIYHTSDTIYPFLGLLIAAVAARLYFAGAIAQARRAVFALLLVGTLGLACYRIFPAIGPIYAYEPLFKLHPTSLEQGFARELLAAALHGPDRFTGTAWVERNVFPSLHIAFTLVALAAAWSWRRRFFWLCLPLAAAEMTTTLTLAVHYLVDLCAAVPLATLCWWLADRGVRHTPHPRDEPLPALAGDAPALRAGVWRFFGALVGAGLALAAWAHFAPLSPWLAWPLAGLVVVPPAWMSLRVNRQVSAAADPAAVQPPLAAPATPWRVRLLGAAVFCSGGTALVLEQIYEKYLSVLLGASRPAATIVLAVYFAGLALGAWLCPKKLAGAPRRLAALELFVAGWAVLVGLAFFACDRWLGSWLAGIGSTAFGLAADRTLLAALWILPPTLAMGAQLPTLAAVLGGHPLWQGRTITRYYAINLAGAFVFTVATPPLLFATVGADGALWTIAALGAVVGGALWFGLPRARIEPAPAFAAAPPAEPAPTAPPARATPLALGFAFAAGFGFFALEVVWFHLIGAVCGESVYSFSILLGVVLLGLALAGRRVARSTSGLGPVLGWLVVALAVGNALWPWAGPLMARVRATQQLEWFWGGELLKFCTVALIALPAAALAGQVFPRLLKLVERDRENSRAVGALGAANVVGCVAGALVTGFGFIPLLGAERTLVLLALLAGGAWLVVALRRPRTPLALAPGALGLALLLLLPGWNRLQLTAGYGVYLAPQLADDATLAFFKEDFATGFVTVVSTPSETRAAPIKMLLQNGKFDANDAGEMPAQLGFGLVAALHAPATDRALVIGCGSGQTAGLIARLGFAHLDLAEMSPAHLAAARAEFSDINAGLLDRPNVSVHLEDGRNYLLRTPHRYDLVQIEITSVWFAGATNLYSREFYALVRRHLVPGGVFVQWFQLHHLTPRELAVILATAQAEFPSVSVWRAGPQACLLASDRPPALNRRVWERWRNSPDLFDERLIAGLSTPDAFAATELVSGDKLRARLARTPAPALDTDRNRWLEFQTPKYYLSRANLADRNLRWLEQTEAEAGR